jgi:signal transduction histidine kinase/ligand-binding sensor domain-containing protein/DNA-binding response OmpR family regulator
MNTIFKSFGIVVCFLLAGGLSSRGQGFEYRFKHLNPDSGLSSARVNAITADGLGFIWLATGDGIDRFDGHEIVAFEAICTDSGTLIHHNIKSLFADEQNRLWVTYYEAGLSCYNIETGELVNFHGGAAYPGALDESPVNKIFEDSNGQIWLGTDGGLFLYDEQEKWIEQKELSALNSETSEFSVKDIMESRNGWLWLTADNLSGGGQGIHIYDPDKSELYQVSTKTNQHLHYHDASTIFEDASGNIWIGTHRHGVIRLKAGYTLSEFSKWKFDYFLNYDYSDPFLKRSYIEEIFETSTGDLWFATHLGIALLRKNNRETDQFEYFLHENSTSVGDNSIAKISEDRLGNIWAISNSMGLGLFRYDYTKDTFQVFKNDKHNNHSIQGNKYSDLFIDQQDIVWVATDNAGVDMLDLRQKKFRTYTHDLGQKYSLSSNILFGMDEDQKGNIWIASYNGLNKLNPATGRIDNFNNDWREGFFNQNEMFEVFCDNRSQLWIGYLRILISRFDPQTLRNNKSPGNKEEGDRYLGWSVRDIIQDRNDNIWIATMGSGLWKYDPEADAFSRFVKDATENSISGNEIFDLHEDKNGKIWIATYRDGLNLFDPVNQTFECVLHPRSTSISLPEVNLHCIAADGTLLWLGTAHSGLIQYDTRSGETQRYTTADGLSSNSILGVLLDEEKSLWLSTRNGLSNFNPETGVFRNFTLEDGIQGKEFNILSYLKGSDGTMYFGGNNGLTAFHPKDIVVDVRKIKPLIHRLNIFNQPVAPGKFYNGQRILEKALLFTEKISLKRKNNVFSIEFCAPGVITDNYQYRYKLEGFDEDWALVPSTTRKATYTDLDPGDYTFLLEAVQNDGGSSEELRHLHITILPAWYETTTFRMLLFFFAVASIILALRLRTIQLRRQKLALQKEVNTRTRELSLNYETLLRRNQQLIAKSKEVSEMSARIHELDQARLRFYSNISHEFRTPLTLMIAPTEQLLSALEQMSISEVQESLNLIYRNEKRLLKLVNQLLELRKIESGKVPLILESGNPLPVLEELASLFKHVARGQHISYSFEVHNHATDNYKLLFDQDKLEKIAFNLISNAFKFTPQGGKVTGSAEILNSGHLKIKIRDTGVGIQSEDLDRIFDRFSSTAANRPSSTGIGLAYVKELVDTHKGEINVQSTPQKGTCFEVTLPVAGKFYGSDQATKSEPFRAPENNVQYVLDEPFVKSREQELQEATFTEPLPDKNIQILIVEDNSEIRKLLSDHLERYFTVYEAPDGEQGVALALKRMPDIVLCDIMMPGMNGLEVCQILKSRQETSHIPVVLLTALGDDKDQLAGITQGADDYIVKPFNVKILTAKLLNLVAIRKKLRERFARDSSLVPESLAQNNLDENFISSVVDFIRTNIQDTDLNADRIARHLHVSRSFVYKKIQALSGKSVNEFIRIIRLKYACELMKDNALTLSEVAYSSGFSSLNYFSRSFKKQFNQSPSDFQQPL